MNEKWLVRAEHPLAISTDKAWAIIGYNTATRIATGMTRPVAQHVADTHNDWLIDNSIPQFCARGERAVNDDGSPVDCRICSKCGDLPF